MGGTRAVEKQTRAVEKQEPQLRADARRNIELILEAAAVCLARDPDASVADIAKEAGLGRVTLYGHFKSRQDIVEAVVTRTLAEADAALKNVDLSGDAGAALARLVEATWEVTTRFGSLVVAAQKSLPATTLRDLHAGALEERVRTFIRRAQKAGQFRSDVPVDWLLAVFHAVLHAGATEIEAGRLDPDEAPEMITHTMLGALGQRISA